MNLAALLAGIAVPPRDLPVADLTLDSREVVPGGAFLACAGDRHHGLDFAEQVVARGVAAILWETQRGRAPPSLPEQIVVCEVPRLGERASELADRFFARPSQALAVVGITGTNGKTTSAWLLAQALTHCGRRAAYLGTLGASFDGQHAPSERTTPDAVAVQRQLAGFLSQRAAAVAMEVSSHALSQHRVAAVQFDAAVFTNLTRDHLDYHGSMQNYGAAKAGLFERTELRLRVINADDAFGAALLARNGYEASVAFSAATGFKPSGPFVRASQLRATASGLACRIESSFGTADLVSPLVGRFNLENLLAVLGVLLGSDVPLAQAVEALAQVTAPPGRMERFGGGALPLVVVDYAHTPDGLDKALHALRAHCAGRLICVFGCGGDRDRGKRPEMGNIAAVMADTVIVTDDNPRGESPQAIAAEILAGIDARRRGAVRVIHDRAAAITAAVAMAAPGDVVLIAGKGHETLQTTGAESRPFSDQAWATTALAGRHAA